MFELKSQYAGSGVRMVVLIIGCQRGMRDSYLT